MKIYQYSLSTAWDISTASYDSKSFDISGEESFPSGLFFKSDGTKFYIIGFNNYKIYQYSLSTAWDISTASYDSKNFNVSSQDNGPSNLFFKPDGSKFYITGITYDSIYQFNINPTGEVLISELFVFDLENPSSNAYKSCLVSIVGTGLDNLKFYIGEYDGVSNTYSEVTLTGTSNSRTGSLTLSGDNRRGLVWKAEVDGDTVVITKLIITYTK